MAKQLNTFGFVGGGAMGGAIARGLVERGALEASQVAVADPSEQVRTAFGELGVSCFASGSEMVGAFDPDVVVIAVKPQVLPGVVAPLAESLRGRLVVSIAAGVKIATLEGLMPEVRVVRCMPNLPMQVASGAVAITKGTLATDEDVAPIQELLSHLAVARVMREDQLDVAGVVTGCSPAFFALFVDCLTRAGVEAGLPSADCREMVESTMRGVAEQLLSSGDHPRSYMERVSSPGGTTIKATSALEPDLFLATCDAVDAALARTRELAGE